MALRRSLEEKAFGKDDAGAEAAARALAEPSEEPPEAPPPPAREVFDISVAGVVIACVGAAVMLVSVFLPRVESATFLSNVQENTLIQSGDGWILIGLAVLTAGSAYRSRISGNKAWAPILAGLIAIGAAYYEGTNKDQLTLYPVGAGGQPNTTRGSVATAGIGIWAAGVGGALALAGGIQMRRDSTLIGQVPQTDAAAAPPPPPPPPPADAKKVCPECAESVMAAAKVCRFCGYRFQPPPAVSATR